eukprot:TRINITY_DN9014_c0_g1_i1.p1 TRINITY_DN9014_c0_g1~~TRINITY_DN9014_c0_g1_i1.p1  ORF type:complete len:595 (-),score=63.22 TRINITY_DN9014_c0_g1_i1:93-1820(-)
MAIYLTTMVALGIIGHCKKRSSTALANSNSNVVKDHYLASGELGRLVIFMTLFASSFSGYVMVGLAGDTYRLGYSSVQWVCAIASISGGMLFFGPMIHKQTKTKNYMSPLDYISDRYHSTALFATTWLCSLIPLLIYIFGQMKAMGETTHGLTDGSISALWGSLALGVVMLIYETLGGMRSVAWTDVLQGTILIIGFSIILVMGSTDSGGLGHIAQLIKMKNVNLISVPTLKYQAEMGSFMFQLFFATFYYHMLQRIMAAKDEQTLQFSTCVLPWTIIVPLSSLVIGLLSIVLFDIPINQSDQVFSLVLKHFLEKGGIYYWIVSFLLSAVVASFMSTGDSALMAISSLICLDLVKRYLYTSASDRFILVLSKLCSIVVLAASILLSVLLEIELKYVVNLQYNMLMQISPAFLLGIKTNINFLPILFGQVSGVLLTIILALSDIKPLNIDVGIYGLCLNIGVIYAVYQVHRVLSYNSILTEEYSMNSSEDFDHTITHQTKEPYDYWHIWVVYAILMLLMIPFYRKVGAIDTIILGFPVWGFVSILLTIAVAIGLTFSAKNNWELPKTGENQTLLDD